MTVTVEHCIEKAQKTPNSWGKPVTLAFRVAGLRVAKSPRKDLEEPSIWKASGFDHRGNRSLATAGRNHCAQELREECASRGAKGGEDFSLLSAPVFFSSPKGGAEGGWPAHGPPLPSAGRTHRGPDLGGKPVFPAELLVGPEGPGPRKADWVEKRIPSRRERG